MNTRFRYLLISMALALSLSGISATIAAEPKEKKEYDPHITYLFPAGGQKGTTVEAMVRGRGLDETAEARVSGEGVTAKVLAIEEPSTKLQQRSKDRQDVSENPNVVRLLLTIAADAPLGQRDLRLITPKGVTNRFRFIVGQLPEINEIEPEATEGKPAEDQAQPIESLPVLVNGQIFQGDRDVFRFSAKAGQTIVCDFHGRKILPYIADAVPGWLQASLKLTDASGKEVAYNDDFRFHPDPMLIYHVEKDGEYSVEVKDVLFRGREDLVYRLAIGELPCITHIFPLGGKRGSQAQVELHGVNLPADTSQLDLADDCPAFREIQAEHKGLSTNALPFAVDDIAELTETEPNNSKDQATKIEIPVAVNGRIQESGDVDCFLVSVKAKQRLVIDVRARRLESPMDSILSIIDARGRQLVENDDTIDAGSPLITHHADSQLIYTFPADGDYVIKIRDVQNKGGEEYAYRLTIAPPRPDFALLVTPDNPRLGGGDTVALTANAIRRDGFRGEIELSLDGLPEGCVVSNAVIPAGQDQVRLTITAPADAPLGLSSPKIVGRATVDGREIVREASPAEAVMQAFIYYHNLPTAECLMAITKPAPFALSLDSPTQDVLEIPRGKSIDVVVQATRRGDTKGAIRLTADTPPRGLTVRAASIAADKDEATVTITATNQLAVGFRQNLLLTGALRIGKETITGVAPAVAIRVIDPAAAKDDGPVQKKVVAAEK